MDHFFQIFSFMIEDRKGRTIMKKWFITFCALFLFATVIPQVSAADLGDGKSGHVFRNVQVIKFENKNGIIVKTIEELAFTEVPLKNVPETIQLAKNTAEKIISQLHKATKQPNQSEKKEKPVVNETKPTVPTQNEGVNPPSQKEQHNPSTPVEENVETPSNKGLNNEQLKQILDQYLKEYQSNFNGEKTVTPAPTTPSQPVQTPEVKEEPTISQPTNQVSEFERQVVELTNAERAKAGLKPLTMYAPLMAVAKAKSQDMANLGYFSHTSPTYGSPFDQMRAAGIQYRAAGENIAQGQRTPEQVVNAWMNSPGHRANILNANYTHIGVGFVENGYYWTQQFIQM